MYVDVGFRPGLLNFFYFMFHTSTSTRQGTRLVCDPAGIVGRITLVRLGLVK